MLRDRIEHRWIEAFASALALSKIGPGDEVAILSETQSRTLNVHLAELALLRLGAKPIHVTAITPNQTAPVVSFRSKTTSTRNCSWSVPPSVLVKVCR